VKHRGDGENGSAERGPARADEKAEKNDRLKRDVGGEEVGYGGADPDAKGEGDKEEGEQGKSLLGTALFGEEEAAERGGAREYAGYGRHDTQLDEQGDENEPFGHVNSV